MKYFVILVACACFLEPLKGLNKKEILSKIDQLLDERQLEKLSEYLKKNDKATCQDDPTTKASCPHWAANFGCVTYRETMREYCAGTCDLCRPPAPPIPNLPNCAKTVYGCCWDNKTEAKGPVENLSVSQCLPCLDKQSKTFCMHWKPECDSPIKGQGNIMKKLCPTTCGVPCDYNLNINKCKDKSSSCSEWFIEGKCTDEAEKMKVYCPSMCGFC